VQNLCFLSDRAADPHFKDSPRGFTPLEEVETLASPEIQEQVRNVALREVQIVVFGSYESHIGNFQDEG
jgi:hypothetical protein